MKGLMNTLKLWHVPIHRRSQDFRLGGGGQTRNHIGEDHKKKESSQFDLGFVIGGGRNLIGYQLWNGSGGKPQDTEWEPTLKNT